MELFGASHTIGVVTSRFRRGVMPLVLLCLLALGPAAGAGSVTEEDVSEARTARQDAANARAGALVDLDAAVAEYEAINSEFQELTFRIGRVWSRIADFEDEIGVLTETIKVRAVEAYMHGRERDPVVTFESAEGVQQAIIARRILAQTVESEAAALQSLQAIEAELGRLRGSLDSDGDRVSQLRADAEAVAARMSDLFAVAQAELESADENLAEVSVELAERRRLEEEERLRQEAEARRLEEERRRAEELRRVQLIPEEGAPAGVTPGFLCPVDGISRFVDTWGPPRSGGRKHKVVDMMAQRGTPLVAVGAGLVEFGRSALGGNIAWLHADHGASYFYAHLDSFAADMRSGQRVERGRVIGFVGDTGNPAPGAYHLHFGIYPGGNTAVNPYPTVARTCQR